MYGMVGLGRMGAGLVRRLLDQGQVVAVYDVDPHNVEELALAGAVSTSSLQALAAALPAPRVIWLMVPAGDPVEGVLEELAEHLQAGDVVIDGGNSFFRDSVRRHADLARRGIRYLDCGSSGGWEGARDGMCLMVGGDREAYEQAEPLFRLLAASGGYAYVGASGSGHYVKMVHNAIEYGMLEAIGEGFELLNAGAYPGLDLARIANLWSHGSVIRGWLMELLARHLAQDPNLSGLTGEVGGGGTGSWAIEQAWEAGVPFQAIALSYAMRLRTRQSDTFAGKVVAALRWEFGRHPVTPARPEGKQGEN